MIAFNLMKNFFNRFILALIKSIFGVAIRASQAAAGHANEDARLSRARTLALNGIKYLIHAKHTRALLLRERQGFRGRYFNNFRHPKNKRVAVGVYSRCYTIHPPPLPREWILRQSLFCVVHAY